MSHRRITPGLLFLGALTAGACSSTASTVAPPVATLRIISGAQQSDTIESPVAQPLVVEVDDATGAPVASATVNLEPYPIDSSQYAYRFMSICHAPGNCNPYGYSTTTDATGRLTIYAQFGTLAGNRWIYVSAPQVGIRDSVPFTARPGNPVHFGFSVADSSAYPGSGYATVPRSTDRRGNTTALQPFTVQALGPAATITSDGVFHAVQIGRGMAVFRAGTIVDTAWITVPPRGQVAAFDLGLLRPSGIVTFELDGSHFRRWTPIQDNGYGEMPDWLPNGKILFQGNGDLNVQHVMVTDSNGAVVRLTPTATPTFLELEPAAGRDGAIYFAGRGPGDADYRLWKSLGVGALPTRVDTITDNTAYEFPSPSPDGTRLAYSISERGLYVYTLVAGSNTKIAAAGARNARWSPDGSQLVFNDDSTLYLMHPDGTARRRTGTGHLYYPRADWSGDGAWLIARTRNRLELINVTTDEAIVLPPWTEGFLSPAWRH